MRGRTQNAIRRFAFLGSPVLLDGVSLLETTELVPNHGPFMASVKKRDEVALRTREDFIPLYGSFGVEKANSS